LQGAVGAILWQLSCIQRRLKLCKFVHVLVGGGRRGKLLLLLIDLTRSCLLLILVTRSKNALCYL
jgi:hypothetical protein